MLRIFARGHENITAKHKTTLEITRDAELTPRGDCIIAVDASISLPDFPENFKSLLRKDIIFEVRIDLPDYKLSETLTARGSEKLPLTHPTDMVIRKSKFVCPRTLLVSASKAARDLDREVVEMLKDKKTEVVITLQPLRDLGERG